MGLCKSCFSSKYGSSPEETDPEPDAEMLLSDRSKGSGSRTNLITAGPEPEKIIDQAAVLLTNLGRHSEAEPLSEAALHASCTTL